MNEASPETLKSPITVRLATVADIPAIIPMMIDFNRYEGIDWDPRRGEAPLRTLLQDERLGIFALFSTEDTPSAGYAIVTFGFDLEFGGRDAFLTDMFLAETLRGRGLGKLALAQVCALTQQAGAFALHLQVRSDNVAAQKLYQTSGFVGTTRIFMSKPLSPDVKLSNTAPDPQY